MKKTIQYMMQLIRVAIDDKNGDDILLSNLPSEEWKSILETARRHDLAHIVGYSINKKGYKLEKEVKNGFEKAVFQAIYRYELQKFELDNIRSVLSNEKIPFVVLKGSIIRDYYPEPWMRTSCDIDVLVSEEDLKKAKETLVKCLNYTEKDDHYHDVSLFSPSGVHLELHFNLKENIDYLDRILEKCWIYKVDVGNSVEQKFSNEFFVYHLYAHAAYHFLKGGCGARTLIDFYLLLKKMPYDQSKVDIMLEESGIKIFADNLNKLAMVWFSGEEHTTITNQMEDYLIFGGVYGNFENNYSVECSKKGKIKTLLTRIWLPFADLAMVYPQIKEKRYLQLFYEIHRWTQLLDKKRFYHGVSVVKFISKTTENQVEQTKKLLINLGLKN